MEKFIGRWLEMIVIDKLDGYDKEKMKWELEKYIRKTFLAL